MSLPSIFIYLWLCARCQIAEFYLDKDDARSRDDCHRAVNEGHKPEIKRVFIK